MSHVAAIDLEIAPTQLDALEAAITELGGTLVRNQKSYKWYGQLVGGGSRGAEFDNLKTAPGVCAHAIRPAGWKHGDYEGGVVEATDGTFRLVWDSYATGVNLDRAFGVGGTRIKDHLGAELAMRHAARKGQRARKEILADGTVAVDVYVD